MQAFFSQCARFALSLHDGVSKCDFAPRRDAINRVSTTEWVKMIGIQCFIPINNTETQRTTYLLGQNGIFDIPLVMSKRWACRGDKMSCCTSVKLKVNVK